MHYTAETLAKKVNGMIEGDPTVVVSSFSKIEEGRPGTLSFLANPKYAQYLYTSQSSVILIDKDFQPEKPIHATLIRVENPYLAFATLLEDYTKSMKKREGIAKTVIKGENVTIGDKAFIGDHVIIGDHVTIGDNCRIFPNSYIGDHVTIGDECTFYSGVNIYHSCEIGNNVTLHSGVVIGADGFGFAPRQGDQFMKIEQIGNVLIEDHVEIGANTTVDRATLGSTIIRKGVKLDNLIQIAHNVEIGENTVIASQTGVSGSSKVGSGCMIGGQVGIAGHLTIGNNVRIAGSAGIGNDIKDNAIIMGHVAFHAADFKRSYVLFKRFPQIVKRLEALEKKLNS
ncbi:MAG: UDP-3-O-(3-hydroxymyristoyl)glucosamine N-acyltransferase [Bacteroidetes bacterium]|nr:MAG: UDP-3-O-(3-hydroxymyristoyl)glucosamine N-acyltransferase [Bacteroidota bacterium]PIE87719.1 MAG: UDP-3-O-(3-hydroxymyristoyl)glucosamine N-acyltransferase [Bacteroidota bacterium]